MSTFTGNVTIHCGSSGHEYECVIRIDGFDSSNYIPAPIEQALLAALPGERWPDGWGLMNRGSRLEARPPCDIDNEEPLSRTTAEHGEIVAEACRSIGLLTTVEVWSR
jgi:hypothetical protein